MKPPSVEYLLILERQQRIQHQAEQIRLSRLCQDDQPGVTGRILMGVGGWMVRQGTRLQARYETASNGFTHPETNAVELSL